MQTVEGDHWSLLGGDHVFLKANPQNGLSRFSIWGKLAQRYIGPFEIQERVGEDAYRLALHMQLSNVHNVFHISMLRKYKLDTWHILNWQELDIQDNVSYDERPREILDTKEQVLWDKTIRLVKVLWRHHGVEEATWELESTMRSNYLYLFSNSGTYLNFDDEISSRGVGCSNPRFS